MSRVLIVTLEAAPFAKTGATGAVNLPNHLYPCTTTRSNGSISVGNPIRNAKDCTVSRM